MREERIRQIYEILENAENTNADELARQLSVSPATIRRDLSEMERLKLIERYYGGARINKDIELEPSMHAKHLINMESKSRIARYSASLIRNNDVVYIDAGTTTEAIIDYISAKNILVVTQALSILQKLNDRQIKCYTLGGYIRFNTNIIIDNDTVEKISRLHFNIAFLGANGISPYFGFSTTNDIEAMLKKGIIRQADKTYVLADTSKFDVISYIKFAELDEADIITDAKDPKKDYSAYKRLLVIDE